MWIWRAWRLGELSGWRTRWRGPWAWTELSGSLSARHLLPSRPFGTRRRRLKTLRPPSVTRCGAPHLRVTIEEYDQNRVMKFSIDSHSALQKLARTRLERRKNLPRIWRIAARLFVTPVDVSLCTTQTALTTCA